jgi:hypothetical protein
MKIQSKSYMRRPEALHVSACWVCWPPGDPRLISEPMWLSRPRGERAGGVKKQPASNWNASARWSDISEIIPKKGNSFLRSDDCGYAGSASLAVPGRNPLHR